MLFAGQLSTLLPSCVLRTSKPRSFPKVSSMDKSGMQMLQHLLLVSVKFDRDLDHFQRCCKRTWQLVAGAT